MKKIDAVIAGYTCIDIVPIFFKNNGIRNLSSFLKPGKLIEIRGINFVLGGVVPNTGLSMKKFGINVFLNGLIGDDLIGDIFQKQLKNYRVSNGMVKTTEAGTAFGIVLAPPGTDRIFLESTGCNQVFNPYHINFEMVSMSRLFHFGYPPLLRQFYLDEGKNLVKIFSKIKQMGILTSLDLSLPDPESESGKLNWEAILKKALPYVDIFAPSLEEILYAMMHEKYNEINSKSEDSDFVENVPIELIRKVGRMIIRSGVKILLIKMGSRGAYLHTGNVSLLNANSKSIKITDEWNFREIWCNAYNINKSRITHATGAGDVAVAAFLSAILNGELPESAIKYAAIAGRESLYCHNIHDDLVDWGQLTEKINYEQNELIFLERTPDDGHDTNKYVPSEGRS